MHSKNVLVLVLFHGCFIASSQILLNEPNPHFFLHVVLLWVSVAAYKEAKPERKRPWERVRGRETETVMCISAPNWDETPRGSKVNPPRARSEGWRPASLWEVRQTPGCVFSPPVNDWLNKRTDSLRCRLSRRSQSWNVSHVARTAAAAVAAGTRWTHHLNKSLFWSDRPSIRRTHAHDRTRIQSWTLFLPLS